MRKIAVIVAGGLGSRMNASKAKQLMSVGDKTILEYTLDRFQSSDKDMELILVLNKTLFDDWADLVGKNSSYGRIKVVEGGQERFHSVQNALQSISDENGPVIVAIHDAARPMVSLQVIEQGFEMAYNLGTAVPVIDINESLRQIQGDESQSLDRSQYKIVQTPQCFELRLLADAYQTEYRSEFTDDASVAEARGLKINLYPGNSQNIKITNPTDLEYFRFMVQA